MEQLLHACQPGAGGDTAGQRDARAFHLQQRAVGALGQVARHLDVVALQQHAELVTTDAPCQCAGRRRDRGAVGGGGCRQSSGGGLQGAGDTDDRLVTGGVPEPVVDALEAVDVADQQHQRVRRGAGGHQALQPLVEGTTVGQPRQGIGVGQSRHAFAPRGAGDPCRDVRGDREHELPVVAVEGRRARGGGGPQLSPRRALDDDGHGDGG